MSKVKSQNMFDISEEEFFAFESYNSKWRKREVRDIFLLLTQEFQSLDTMFIFKRYVKLKNILSLFTSQPILKKLLLLKRPRNEKSARHLLSPTKIKQDLEEANCLQMHPRWDCLKCTDFGCPLPLRQQSTDSLNLPCDVSMYNTVSTARSNDVFTSGCDKTTLLSSLSESSDLISSISRLVVPLVRKSSLQECHGIERNVIENGKIPHFIIPNRKSQRSPRNVLPDATLYSIPSQGTESRNISRCASQTRPEKSVPSRKKQRCQTGLIWEDTGAQNAWAFSAPLKRKRTLVTDSENTELYCSWNDAYDSCIQTNQGLSRTENVSREQGQLEKLDNTEEIIAHAYDQILILKDKFDSLKGRNAIHKYKQMQDMLQACLDNVNLCQFVSTKDSLQ